MGLRQSYKAFIDHLEQPISIAPLVTFRIAFGLVMLFSTVRYMALGWVDSQLIDPAMHFHYYGFGWIEPLPGAGMYAVFVLMCLTCVGIALGWYYRFAAFLFFLCFSYVELIDLTYYLNHYYFVSIVSFLLILAPANRRFSLDVARNPELRLEMVSRWCIDIFKLQIAIVYCYAGLAKINDDWLLKALPLAIWLPAKTSIPIIGPLMKFKMTAYVFSWLGMLFDTLIVGGLLWRKTRWLAFGAVVTFHSLTGILFPQIGVFPLVMILGVTIFFSASFHEKMLKAISKSWSFMWPRFGLPKFPANWKITEFTLSNQYVIPILFVFFLFQIAFPWRYLLYPGNVFWTEEGYRFSWRVMLMEKAGTATFYVKDGEDGREGAVINQQFLNDHQEKQMAMQPDMILQFGHVLADHYRAQGMADPKVRAEAWVTLNARSSRLLIDPNLDLTTIQDGWGRKEWILPFDQNPDL